MKNKYKYLFVLCLPLLLGGCQVANNGEEKTLKEKKIRVKRIITIGGTITEITHTLGFGKEIIATDKTSTYPVAMKQLTSLGYRNSIKAEGVLKMEPDIVLAQEDCIDPVVCEQLRESGVDVKVYSNDHTVEKTKELIKALGIVLNVEDRASGLISTLSADLSVLNKFAVQEPRPKVLFIYARGSSTQSIAGKGTFAETIIDLAGGEMAIKEIEGYKPLTAEALVNANPDYLLFFDSGLLSLGGSEGALQIPGISETNAGRNRNFLSMDGLLLSGFGPRLGRAALELRKLIHPEELTVSNESHN